MTHLSEPNLKKYAAGDLSPSEFLSFDDHLSGCELCREQLAAATNVAATAAGLRSEISAPVQTQHLTYDELESYVDQTADETDREIAASHLEMCPQCTEQLQQLNKLKSDVFKKRKLVNRVKYLWGSPEYSTIFRAVSLAAVIAFMALILNISIKRTDKNLQAELDKVKGELRIEQQTISRLNHQIAQLKKPAPPAELIASIHDSIGLIGVDHTGNLVGAENFSEQQRNLAESVFDKQNLPIPNWVKELQGSAEVLMGESSDGYPIQLISAVGMVLESTTPEFRWNALAGARDYQVSVYDPSFKLIIASGPVSQTSWTCRTKLSRGVTYTWKLSAVRNGEEIFSPIPPAPPAKFKILEQEKLQEITNLRKEKSHLMLAIAYSQAGMLPEARLELSELSKQNPSSPLISKLLRNTEL
jgi:hypothetical protein